MAVTLLAATLLAQATPGEMPNARQLYDACRVWVDTKAARSAVRNGGAVPSDNLCQQMALEVMLSAVESEDGLSARICLPEQLWRDFDPAAAMAAAYLAYLDRSPGERDSRQGPTVFRRAMVQNWPCPR